MKRFLCLLALLGCWTGFAQAPILRQALTTNNFSISGFTSYGGIVLSNKVPIQINDISTNNFLASGGLLGIPRFRSITAADLPAGTVSGSGTPNTVAIWTGANTLSNSSITDDGSEISSILEQLTLGPDDTDTTIFINPRANTNGAGSYLTIQSGAPGVDGASGQIDFITPDAVGVGDNNSGDINFITGNPTGSGSGGQINFASGTGGDMTISSGNDVNISASNGRINISGKLRPDNNVWDIGDATHKWIELHASNSVLYGYLQLSGNTNQYTDNGTTLLRNGSPISATGDTTATNIVTLAQTGTNVTAMDFSLVARGGVFKLSLTNNAFMPTPSNVGNTTFSKCWLAVQQPSTGTCFLTWTNNTFAFPESNPWIIDTNNGAVTYFELVSDVFSNGVVNVWMSTRMGR